MRRPAIRIQNLSKRYVLKRAGRTTHDREFWALRDISIEVTNGEVLGVIGANGAGKSTLLKILSRVTPPTAGRVELFGRVASLLEVGTGFHPELTGSDNIFLNGSILGMSRSEITRKYDQIVDFSGISDFIDVPVKHYSSGMYTRLAFAVAAHLDPDILIIDEVLAVGDAAFQAKCLGKMQDVATGGRTVLFVSHNMAAVRQLCQRVVLLKAGQLNAEGSPHECIEAYLRTAGGETGEVTSHIKRIDEGIELAGFTINGASSDRVRLPGEGGRVQVELSGTLKRPFRIELEVLVRDVHDAPLAFFSPGHERGAPQHLPAGPFRITGTFLLPRMNRGDYYLSIYLTEPEIQFWLEAPRAVHIECEGTPTRTGQVFDYTSDKGWLLLRPAPSESTPK